MYPSRLGVRGTAWDNLLGDAWVRFADEIDAHSAPFGLAAIEKLGMLDGASVLDVGCGAGHTTHELARRAGANGYVLGVDLSGRMIAFARSRANEASRAEFVQGDVTALDLPARFDAIYSRNGVMFFDDPVAAFTHLRTMAKPNGRLAFTCWTDPFSNPWMSVPAMASAEVLGPPDLPGPGRPGPFAFAAEETVREVLGGAGWTGIECEELRIERPHPVGDARAVAQMMVATMPPLAAGLRAMPDRREQLVETVAEALRAYERDEGLVLPASA